MKLTGRRVSLLLTLLSMGLLTFAISCSNNSNEKTGSQGKGTSKVDPPEEVLDPLEGEPTVAMWDWEQIQNAPQQHPGKVVVLHIWGLWNEDLNSPDVANKSDKEKKEKMLAKAGIDEFVRLKQLHRDDVVALSLNSDYNIDMVDAGKDPASLKEKVQKFIEQKGANFEHGISTVLDEELVFEKLEIFYTPATLVYDKGGKLRKKFTYNDEKEEWYGYREDVIPLVEKLIDEEYEVPAQPKETPPAEAPKPASDEGSKEKEKPSENNENAKNAEASSSEKVTVQIDNWDGLQKRVAKAKGRVVVVDLWSTQCVPCIKEFPNLVKLHNERNDEVACLSFNLDFYGVGEPEELQPDVLAVLKTLKSTLPNVMSNVADEKVYEKLELASIPSVYVYDREGKLRKRFDDTQGQFTYEKDILPLVETLIKEKK